MKQQIRILTSVKLLAEIKYIKGVKEQLRDWREITCLWMGTLYC